MSFAEENVSPEAAALVVGLDYAVNPNKTEDERQYINLSRDYLTTQKIAGGVVDDEKM